MPTDPTSGDPDLLQRLVNHLPAMVAYWDGDCRNVVANAAYEEWFGVSAQQMPGVHLRDVIGDALYALNLPFVEGVLAGKRQEFDREVVDKGGWTRHTQVSYFPDQNDGRTVGFFVVVSDVTAHFEAEAATARAVEQYRALARSLPDSFVLLFDEQLRYQIADGNGLKAFGLSRFQVEGQTLWDVLPEHAAELESRYRGALQGATSQWTRSVHGRIFELTTAPVTNDDGKLIAGMVVGTDITIQRRLEITGATLHRLALAAVRQASIDELVELVASSALELFQADYASVVRFDADGMRILKILPATTHGGEVIPINDDTAAARVAKWGNAQLIDHDVEKIPHGLADLGLRSSAAAPIRVGEILWGTIGIGKNRPFDDNAATIDLLEDFADLVSVAISNNIAWEELGRLARIDPLTALPNRRVFQEQLEKDCKRATRTGLPIAVAILDLDNFKMINDAHGHPVGDVVLVEAANRLKAISRGEELVARLGGEEFAIVMLNCEEKDLPTACERFRHAICDSPFNQGITMTASVGGASGRGHAEPEELVRLADDALYIAKKAGRNQVALASVSA